MGKVSKGAKVLGLEGNVGSISKDGHSGASAGMGGRQRQQPGFRQCRSEMDGKG